MTSAYRNSFIVAGFVFAIAILLQLFAPLNSDAAWLLYMSQQTTQGQTPYVDLVEVNPPLIIWLKMPAVWLAESSGLSVTLTFKAQVFLLAALSTLLSVTLNLSFLSVLAPVIAFVLVALPSVHFGQREHFMLIFSLPYICLAVARARQLSIPQWQIIAVPIAAAIGFCIKPYFVFVPALLELFLLSVLGLKTLKRPEPYLMVCVGLLYLAAIFKLTPNYVSEVIGYAQTVYDTGFRSPFSTVLTNALPEIVIGIIGLTYLFKNQLKKDRKPTSYFQIMTIVVVALFAGYFWQMKGWANHVYPAKGIFMLATVAAIYLIFKDRQLKSLRLIQVTLLAVLSIRLVIVPLFETTYASFTKNELRVVLDQHPDANSVFIMSSLLHDSFPLVIEKDVIWASRFPALWMTPGLEQKKAQAGLTPELAAIDSYIYTSVTEDIIRYKPDIVFVDIREDKTHFGGLTYDFVKSFSSYAPFAAEWKNYELSNASTEFELYVRKK